MPFNQISDLPDSVRGHLPAHAQEIYREAFNHAWEEYKSSQERRAGSDREETAHKVAWSAVKRSYKKNSVGKWVRK